MLRLLGERALRLSVGGQCVPIRLGTKRNMFSLDRGAPDASSAWAAPLPFMTTCSSGCDSGSALVGVSIAAAARAACRRVLAPDMMT